MLAHLLDVLDEKKDAERLDALLDETDDLFFNLILYYYSPQPQRSGSSSLSSTSSPPLQSPLPSSTAPPATDYTLQEQALCTRIAKFTAMHPSHIFECYNRVKSVEIDTFAIHEIQIWNYVFEERQRVFTALIGMLTFVIECESASSQFANSIYNHIQKWIHKGWKKKIVECYIKLTSDDLPNHLPPDWRHKYCECIAEEQLLLWKVLFLLYYEPIQAQLEDIDLFFELYPLSLKKVIPIYINKCSNSYALSKHKIHEIMKKIDDLLIAVFMELLPVEHVHGHVEQFEFLVNEQRELQSLKVNYKLAHADALKQIQEKLELAFSKTQANNHLRNIWKIYCDLGYKLAKIVKLLDEHHANPDAFDIYEKIEQVHNNSENEATDAVTPANLIQCFEKILITFGDCDDSKCFIKPMQCIIKSYLDAILSKDPDVLVDSDNIHYLYHHILSDNHDLCRTFFVDNKLQTFPLWKYAMKSFITQPYLKLGLLASLCSSPATAKYVYQLFSHNKGYFTLKAQVERFITMRKDAPNQPPSYYAKHMFEWNFIQIARGAKGTITKGRDGVTEIMCWDTEWNGFLWLLSLLVHCIHPQQEAANNNNTESYKIGRHNIAYMTHNALPSAMRLLTRLTEHYPEAIQLIANDIQLLNDTSSSHRRYNYISNRKYIASHPQSAFKLLRQYPHLEHVSLSLFVHCMQRLKEYDYAAHSITNSLQSTKDNYDWNLDLFKDATAFFKFVIKRSKKNVIYILHTTNTMEQQTDSDFFCKLIVTLFGVISQCIYNANQQMCGAYGDELAYEKSQYQLKCVWNIIGFLIDIVNKIFVNRDIFYFQQWELDVKQYVLTVLGIYPAIYPTTCLDIYANDKKIESSSIELHYKAINLIYNIVKGDKAMKAVISDKFCDDNDDGFRNFIIGSIIHSNEIITHFASNVRSTDQRFVSEIICESMKIIQLILIDLNMDQRQEIMTTIAHKLNANRRDSFEQISLADKICQLVISLEHSMHTNLVYQCIKFLKFLCYIFPAKNEFSYQDLFNSMTEIERLSEWMAKYLNIKKWRKQSDINKVCHILDLLCIFMSNQNRLRHILLKPNPNPLLTLLFDIMKHKDSFTKYSHITAKCLEIFWLLHSDLDVAVYPFIDIIWEPIANILSTDLQNVSTDKRVEAEHVSRCWQNECFAWCFRIILQEIEQTLSFFDEIDVQYSNRRKSINKLIHELAIEKQLLIKWMQLIVAVPGISVDLLNKRNNIAVDFKIELNDFRSDALRLYGDHKDYGRNCVDKYHKLVNKLRLLSLSAEFALNEKEKPQKYGHKRKRSQQDLEKLNSATRCVQVIEEFNLQKSLVLSHHLMLSAWCDFMQHICLCAPHIIGLQPITCYNKKLSESHLEATLNRIRTLTSAHKTFVSPSKRDLNQEQSIKQLFHWNILHSLPKPKKQSEIASQFCLKLSKMLNTAFKHMMDPKYFNLNENVLNCSDLESHLSHYLTICAVLRDLINHLTQDLEDEHRDILDHNALTFDLSKRIFQNIAECIQIASKFGANRSKSSNIASPANKKQQRMRLFASRIPMIDNTIELLLTVAMVLIKWMLHYGPKIECNQAVDPNNTSFISSIGIHSSQKKKKKKSLFAMPTATPIKKRLQFGANQVNDNENDNKEDHDSDDDVLHDISYISATSGPNQTWLRAMSACLQILSTLCSTSAHLIVCDDRMNVSSAVTIFPYLIRCMSPYTDVSLDSIKEHKFIEYCMNYFASISNYVVNAFISKQKQFSSLDKESQTIKDKLFQTKSDEERLIHIEREKIVIEKEYVLSAFIPSIEKLSSVLQCFVSIAQQSLDGVILLFENELLLYLTNCSIFKSSGAQFVDPYLEDSREENPCHELWCKALELISYLLRQSAHTLTSHTTISADKLRTMSSFMRNIMQFCSVHHDRILNKIKYIAHQDSDLRLRDLEEINIISSFIYEIEKNELLIAQQSVDNKVEFELHRERFNELLHILSKFTILLESPKMLQSLTPPISTHEKYAFGYYNKQQQMETIGEDMNNNERASLERQRSRHVQWASDVSGGNSSFIVRTPTVSIASDDEGNNNNNNNANAGGSPLPLGRLLKQSMDKNKKERSVDTNIGDDEDADATLRRDQFLQRIEYYILEILKHILFCCRYDILDNWNHRRQATYLFTPNLRPQHFLSSDIDANCKPHLSVLVRLSRYAITHLKGLYQTRLSELNEEENHSSDPLQTGILRASRQKKRADSMYDPKKVESEGKYHMVTWKNIEKTLWVLFEHCYINLLLQIDCFMQCNQQIVLQNIVQYRSCLDKLWKRITRFETFLHENKILTNNSVAAKEMKFITVLRERQHHQLTVSIEALRNKYMPNIAIQRGSSDNQTMTNVSVTGMRSQATSDALTDVTGGMRRISGIGSSTTMNQSRSYNYYTNYTPQSRHFSARSNASSNYWG